MEKDFSLGGLSIRNRRSGHEVNIGCFCLFKLKRALRAKFQKSQLYRSPLGTLSTSLLFEGEKEQERNQTKRSLILLEILEPSSGKSKQRKQDAKKESRNSLLSLRLPSFPARKSEGRQGDRESKRKTSLPWGPRKRGFRG